MKTPLFHGSCTAIITPWCENGIDYDRFSRLIEHQFENGTAALLVCGTTGENATMSENEHNELVRFAVNASSGRMKIIAGVGSNDTEKALRFAQNAKAVGADGILMVTPYYNKTSQRGLISHFNYVADRVDLPMILYNVPGRTGMSIAPDTYEVLAGHPRINGVKEASGDLSLAAEIRSRCGDELNLWSGNDDLVYGNQSDPGEGRYEAGRSGFRHAQAPFDRAFRRAPLDPAQTNAGSGTHKLTFPSCDLCGIPL